MIDGLIAAGPVLQRGVPGGRLGVLPQDRVPAAGPHRRQQPWEERHAGIQVENGHKRSKTVKTVKTVKNS